MYEIDPNFDGPHHPLYALGRSNLLLDKDNNPIQPAPSWKLLYGQRKYIEYLAWRSDWLTKTQHFATFLVRHLDKSPLEGLPTELYSTVAWYYYQQAALYDSTNLQLAYAIARLLHFYPPSKVSEPERLVLTQQYYESAFTKLEDFSIYELLGDYVLFCYDCLQDSEKVLAICRSQLEVFYTPFTAFPDWGDWELLVQLAAAPGHTEDIKIIFLRVCLTDYLAASRDVLALMPEAYKQSFQEAELYSDEEFEALMNFCLLV